MRLAKCFFSLFFEGFQPQNVLIVFLFSMKLQYLTPWYLLTAKITKLLLMNEIATAGDSLHVRQKFSFSQNDVVCICHIIYLEVTFYWKYQSSRQFNFLFGLLNLRMSLIYSSIFNVVTLEKLLLLQLLFIVE